MIIEGLIRVIFFLVVGIVGFVVGGLVGALIGGGIDAAFGTPSQPGYVVISYAWFVSMLGAVLGAVGAVIWLGATMGRSEDRAASARETHVTQDPDARVLAWLTVRQASFGKPSEILDVYLLRATAAERDALIAEIKSHDYWASADVLAEDFRTLPEVTPDEVRRQLFWLFED